VNPWLREIAESLPRYSTRAELLDALAGLEDRYDGFDAIEQELAEQLLRSQLLRRHFAMRSRPLCRGAGQGGGRVQGFFTQKTESKGVPLLSVFCVIEALNQQLAEPGQ
jgi:hypothetical protein